MANTFQYVDWVTMRALRRLVNKMAIGAGMNLDYGKEYSRDFPVGETIRIKLPQRWLIRDGLGWTPQPINRIYTTVNCNQVFGIDFDYDSVEEALKLERSEKEIDEQYINPAIDQIAQEIESRAAKFAYQNTNHLVGVLGTDPVDFDSSSAAARQRLVEMACPPGENCMVVTPSIMRALKKSSISYFNPVTDMTKQWRTGIVGSGDNFEWYESISTYQHTAGTQNTTNTIAGGNQSGSQLTITATAGDTYFAGDKFSIANVNNVNPATRRKVGALNKTFTILQDITCVGGGVDVLSISPAIFGPGSQYQNVDALPANNANMTSWPGTSSPNGKVGTVNLAFNKDAFALVGVKLETPKAVEVSSNQRDPETGLAIRFVKMFDPKTSQMVQRFDVLMGFGPLYPDNCAVAVLGA